MWAQHELEGAVVRRAEGGLGEINQCRVAWLGRLVQQGSLVKPSLRPRASTLPATSTPGDRKTKMGVPGLESCTGREVAVGKGKLQKAGGHQGPGRMASVEM